MLEDGEAFAGVVDLIYEAATDGARWVDVVRAVGGATGGFGGALVLWDTAKGYMPTTHNPGFPPEFWEGYRTNYINVDPRAEGFLRQPELDVYADLMLIDAETRRRNEVMNYVRRETDQGHGYGARLFATRDYQSLLILGRTEARGSAQTADLDRLALLVPHLRRSIAISRKVGERISLATFEALSFGVIVLDQFGRLAFANTAMARIAAERDGIGLGVSGLVLDDPDQDAACRRLVDSMRRRMFLEAGSQRRALPAHRPSGRRPYSILVSPFPRHDTVFPGFGPSVVICVSDPAETSHLSEDMLTGLFGLTPAEGRLAIRLIELGTLKSAADACGLTEESARQYIKRILAKTGTQGQVDLVALLVGSARP